jgi:hypothetical protein
VAGTSFQAVIAELSWPALILLALAIFFLFSTTGLLIDIMAGGRQPTSMLASTVVFSGGIALLYAYGGLRRRPAGMSTYMDSSRMSSDRR